jgi:hypothetical protein
MIEGVKFLTRSEAESKRQKAVEFLQRIGKDDEAEVFETMTPEDYAEHKGAELLENPNSRRKKMARGKTREQLETELDEANDYIEQLEGKLDDIVGIAADEDEDEDRDVDEDSDDLDAGDDQD